MQIKYSWVFAELGREELKTHLNRFARVVNAKAQLQYSKLLMIGGMRVPGFYDCELNEISIARHFGLDIERIDIETIWQYSKKFDADQVMPIVEKLINSEECANCQVKENELFLSVRLALAVADYTRVNGYLGVALKNWPELFDLYGIAGDGAGALVQDLGIPVADESDMGGLLTMVTFNELCQGTSLPTLMDMSFLDPKNNKVGMWHCGGSSTKLIKENTQFEVRNHSILDNYDEESSCGMLFEFLQELGPVTIAKYQYPHASKILAFEGDIVEAPMRYRGCYGEVQPKDTDANSIINTVLSGGLDHHWIVGRGHFMEDLQEFNHWVGVEQIPLMPSEISGRSISKNMNY
jgi:L-fucose isomerase-like protein